MGIVNRARMLHSLTKELVPQRFLYTLTLWKRLIIRRYFLCFKSSDDNCTGRAKKKRKTLKFIVCWINWSIQSVWKRKRKSVQECLWNTSTKCFWIAMKTAFYAMILFGALKPIYIYQKKKGKNCQQTKFKDSSHFWFIIY